MTTVLNAQDSPFDRFSDRARIAVVRAQDNAYARGAEQIEGMDILTGLAAAGGIASRILLELSTGSREPEPTADYVQTAPHHVPFSDDAKSVLAMTLQLPTTDAEQTAVTTERLLDALAHTDAGRQAIIDIGLDADSLVARLLQEREHPTDWPAEPN